MNVCRIPDQLQKAELSEPDIWFRQEIRQAFICVSLASRAKAQPFVQSSYRMYGIHPDKVWQRIVADRRERLGNEYGRWYDDQACLIPHVNIPKLLPTCDIEPNEHIAAVLMFPKRKAAQSWAILGNHRGRANINDFCR